MLLKITNFSYCDSQNLGVVGFNVLARACSFIWYLICKILFKIELITDKIPPKYSTQFETKNLWPVLSNYS